MNKAIQLNKIYNNSKIGDILDVQKFYNEVKNIGLKIAPNNFTPAIEEIIRIENNDIEKFDFDFPNTCQWNIVDIIEIKEENKPLLRKTRLVGEITFKYFSYFNNVTGTKLKLIDSNIWNVYIDGGDGNPFECLEVDGCYFFPNKDDVYTDLSYDFYMDFVTTDGALFTKVRLQNNLSINTFQDAVFENDFKRIKSLIKEGKDINEKNTKGETALMIACRHVNLKMIKFLIEHGADPKIKNNNNMTALDILNEMEKYIMSDYNTQNRKNEFIEVKKMLEQ